MKLTLGSSTDDATATFSRDVTGLEPCRRPAVVELADGDTYELRIGAVVKTIGGNHLRMLSYNGSVPGPTLRVRQGSEIRVHVLNDADIETTVHWHGLRLDNKFDGVPYDTQMPIPVGGTYTYRLRCPDPGVYWYHPHIREDYGIELGLYGNLVVTPADDKYWSPANREVVVTLDDVLVENGSIVAFDRAGPTHVAMGRFGNVMLTDGETDLELGVEVGEVVRLYLTNTANARLFNFAIPSARMKLVGGDSGRYEHERFIDAVLLAPSERAIVDVLFETPGSLPLEHRTPDRTYRLGSVVVGSSGAQPSFARQFASLRTSSELQAQRARIDIERDRAPDKTLEFKSLIPQRTTDGDATVSDGSSPHTHAHFDKPPDGLEWEDLMPEMNASTNPHNMIWKLVDQDTGAVNDDIDWTFRVGEQVKIRLVNQMDQDHPMYHPFHIHGAGRFLVLSDNDVPDPNLVWKDTVLVPAGHTVDILFDVTNPGLWMAHCHIAEHNQGGMMFSFRVTEEA